MQRSRSTKLLVLPKTCFWQCIGTMNPCYARGLAAILPPLPEGEGRGEGEFRCLSPYVLWRDGICSYSFFAFVDSITQKARTGVKLKRFGSRVSDGFATFYGASVPYWMFDLCSFSGAWSLE